MYPCQLFASTGSYNMYLANRVRNRLIEQLIKGEITPSSSREVRHDLRYVYHQ